ncbi:MULTISPECIES: ribonuclease HI [Burkholderiaceae]|uniref:ribonuclease HI n=1 Tax=Burkholderiaceae TaxID=119060 RepID=UPI00074C904C|nr:MULTISPECIES: RNase H family protein [Burkholderiaceae]SAL57803.1 ribonuclease H [Caballeronia peredens]
MRNVVFLGCSDDCVELCKVALSNEYFTLWADYVKLTEPCESVSTRKSEYPGLNDLPQGSIVDVHTHSLYVVKTMRGQFRKGMNLEHWDFLSDAVNRHRIVNFHYVCGHAGHRMNELADSLAKKGSTLSQRNSKSLVNRSASRSVIGGANQFRRLRLERSRRQGGPWPRSVNGGKFVPPRGSIAEKRGIESAVGAGVHPM